jgi:hypothetical protein
MYKWYRFFRFISRKPKTQESGTLFQRLLRIHGTPREVALGFALGIFISLTPTFGIQMLIAFLLATFLKWNRISAIIGVFLSNPLTAPFIYTGTYLAGLTFWPYPAPPFPGQVISLTFFKELVQQTPDLLIIMSIGGAIIGIPAALLSYIIILNLVNRYRGHLKTSTYLNQ